MTVTARPSQPYRNTDIDDPVMIGRPGDRALTNQLLGPMFRGSPVYPVLFAATGLGTLMLFGLIAYTLVTGVGVWGNNIPVGWAFAITNFVWWIGIGHAGTFISAILLLLQQKWRTSINRFAEGMTLFALIQAAMFPLLHLGRPWFGYWLLPYPSTMGVWPQFRSALPWDAAAVTTYLTVSVMFWYLGLVPDLAAARDAAPSRGQRIAYGLFALGWRGSVHQWRHYRVAYLLLAGLATPLVVSVHSIVSMDFAISVLPGWHSPIFPPYFVAGAIYSGFALVLTLMIPARRLFGLQNVITRNHLDNMARMTLVTGSIVTYSYLIEIFCAWYSGNRYERFIHLLDRPFGPYAAAYWLLIFCNCVVPQALWFRRVRVSSLSLFFISILINVGMWTERFVLIVQSQSHDFMPSSWHTYKPTLIDGGIFFGTLCFFLFLFLVFLRFVPFIPLSELKELRHEISRESTEGLTHAEGRIDG